MRRLTIAAVVATTLGATLLPSITAPAAVGVSSAELREAVTVEGMFEHLEAFQAIADANGNTRASGTPGYDESAAYVVERLEAAGWNVTQQFFDYLFFDETATPTLSRLSPDPEVYTPNDDFITMDYSGSGSVPDAPLVATNDIVIPPGAQANTSTSGCEDADFPAETSGAIALVQRGTCTFFDKALNAQEAGAVGAVIFNEGQEGRQETLAGTLGENQDIMIPVTGTSFAIGEELYSLLQDGDVRMEMSVTAIKEVRETSNVLAETRTGRTDRVVMAGAHLDSVTEGPGIQDNGSGSAALIEIAEEISELGIEPRNRLRFAWWGAEEAGLVGAIHYVGTLPKKQLKKIELYLNFDMIGSPNYVRFVYDGSGDIGPKGPSGSSQIEDVFVDYFDGQGLETEPTAFDGRSDYDAFITVGIPAGGLFTGAEGVKTEEQEDTYGGTAGIAYDPCYHQACDDITNVSGEALGQMADGAAHAILTYAMSRSATQGTAQASSTAEQRSQSNHRGHHLVK